MSLQWLIFAECNDVLLAWPFNKYCKHAGTGICKDSWVSTMAADALAPCSTRSSASIMILTMQDKWVLVFHRNLLTKSQCWELTENVVILLSHPGLEWLYVFSLLPPHPPRPPRPPPLKLLPLTSKPFELNLRYLAQRIIWVWGNVLDDLSMTLTQGHGCGIN